MESKTILTRDNVIKNSSGWHFEGKVMVLNEKVIKEEYKESKYQLWYVTGGFGCDPQKIGTAVFAVCLNDGVKARFRRNDFLGVYNGELTKEQQEIIDKLKGE